MGRDIDSSRSPEPLASHRSSGVRQSPPQVRDASTLQNVGTRFERDDAPDPRLRSTSARVRDRESIRGIDTYRISTAERETMVDIGRFRMVSVEDLRLHRYQGNTARLTQDLRSLQQQGLLKTRTLWTGGAKSRTTVVALTKQGKAVLEQQTEARADQPLYAGLVKPGEVAHDTAIYRMYQAEAERIEQAGGKIHRVVLDYELKRNVYSPLAKSKALPPLEHARRKAEIAAQNGLKVIDGRILLPDLRIEYETRDGDRAHIDLELATEHYRGSQVRDKAAAGFRIYASGNCVGRLSAALDQPEIVGEILSL